MHSDATKTLYLNVTKAGEVRARDIQTESVVASESRGLSESLPKPEVREPEAIPIPDAISKSKTNINICDKRLTFDRRAEYRKAQ